MIFLKTEDEIELLRQSNLLVGKTLAEVAKLVKPGVTTRELDKVAEEFKVRLRNERRDANDALKKMEKDGELTEDELKKAQDEVQKITDKFIKEVDQVATAKEKDIMEV